MEGERKYTRSTTKQDFLGELLSKQNIEDSLASLPCNSSRATTERSVIFAFGAVMIVRDYRSSGDSCNFATEANSLTCEVEIYKRQNAGVSRSEALLSKTFCHGHPA